MADPLVPNYKPGVGRLTTDRFDFQKHINGEDFRHDAGIIVLNPAISVNGGPASSNLQEVITQINALVPQVIPDATSSVKGIIKLSGDLAGNGSSATSPRVSGLQGFPITTSTPNNGDLLTYDSGIPGWKPAALSNTFSSLTVNGLVSLNGAVGIAGTLTASGPFTLDGSNGFIQSANALTLNSTGSSIGVTANSSLTLSGQSVSLTGGTGGVVITAGFSGLTINSFGGVVSNSGLSVANGNVSIAKDITIGTNAANAMSVNSTTTFQNNVVFAGTGAVVVGNGIMAFAGFAGRIQYNGIILNNANQTINIRQYKYLVIPSGIISVHTYALDDTSTTNGDWFQIYNASSVNHNLAGAVAFSLGIGQTAQYVKISGTWTRVRGL